jgi:hypothetical protein
MKQQWDYFCGWGVTTTRGTLLKSHEISKAESHCSGQFTICSARMKVDKPSGSFEVNIGLWRYIPFCFIFLILTLDIHQHMVTTVLCVPHSLAALVEYVQLTLVGRHVDQRSVTTLKVP